LNLFNSVKSDVFDEKGLNAPMVNSFEEDRDGNLFVGTSGGGLSRFNLRTRLFEHFNIRSGRKGSDNHILVLTLTKNTKGQLILGMFGDGLFVFDSVSRTYTH